MHRTLAALFLVTFAYAQTPGSAQNAVLTSVHQFVDGFNKGDTKAIVAACADQTSILDEFPPHEWHGTGTCAKWIRHHGGPRLRGLPCVVSPAWAKY